MDGWKDVCVILGVISVLYSSVWTIKEVANGFFYVLGLYAVLRTASWEKKLCIGKKKAALKLVLKSGLLFPTFSFVP